MTRAARGTLAVAIGAAIILGVFSVVMTPVRAADNPCDPTYGMLKNCKAEHGRWDNSCCCCKLH